MSNQRKIDETSLFYYTNRIPNDLSPENKMIVTAAKEDFEPDPWNSKNKLMRKKFVLHLYGSKRKINLFI